MADTADWRNPNTLGTNSPLKKAAQTPQVQAKDRKFGNLETTFSLGEQD